LNKNSELLERSSLCKRQLNEDCQTYFDHRIASQIKEESKMLVLSRKEGERIVIGDNITLVVSKVNGNRVTIGIEAPRDVKVIRGELQDGIAVACPSTDSLPVRSTSLPVRSTLREFAAAVLPMQRQVG
jgi:carbon storage regulator